MRYLLLCVLLFGFFTSSVSVSAQSDKKQYTLYLIGDAGEPSVSDASYRTLLTKQLTQGKDRQSVVFLGDNIYPKGMPLPGDVHRSRAETILQRQIDLAGGGRSPVYFVPGNHDWQRGKHGGWQAIIEQQAWIDSLKNDNIHYYPQQGCPGPTEINLAANLVLVIIDTQWFLHPWDKPAGSESYCDSKSLTDVLTQLDDILRRNAGKRIVIATHHPIYTYGEHGGYFTLREHVFPLTEFNKHLWIPLPVLGSIYPFYRKIFGNIQDTSNPVYHQFASAFHKLLSQYPGVIYAAGHEHNLQYILKDSVHYIVSGAGSKSTPVKRKGSSRFAHSGVGYARIVVAGDGETSVEYYSGDSLLFSTQLSTSTAGVSGFGDKHFLDSTKIVRTVASRRYNKGKSHEKWFGKNYRDVWKQEIDAPVFDIGKTHGGLKIVQRGGGQQTLSLRLQDSIGREYTLRSIEKYPAKAIPEVFRNTFAEDLVQDQISAAHPYGALVIPKLADAAGLYHTNPKVVFIPDDPRFGMYRKDFANHLMLFEERPSGDGKDRASFGYAEKLSASTNSQKD